MQNHEHHHHDHKEKGKNLAKKGASKDLAETKDNLAEKAKHGHSKAMGKNDHSDHSGHSGHTAHGQTGHDHHKMMIDDFKRRFWISLVLALPVIVLSPMIQDVLNYSIGIPYQGWISFIFSSVIFFYGGWPFLTGLLEEIRKGSPGMMTLIGVAITVAYAYSSATVFGLEGMDFFWELATLIVVMLLGHWIEMKSVLGASKALELLVSMMPADANVIREGQTIKVRIEDLQKGDVVLVKPGEKMPADGTVEEGESYLNESMLTGESKPVGKVKGDRVIGGSINENGSLKVRVEHTGEESYLKKVINLVQDAQKTKSETQHLADKAAKC